MKKSKEEIIDYINSLEGYEGYVQFSDRPIEDIWTTPSNIAIDTNDGFVYEAHFCNGIESIAIKQVNSEWLVSVTQLSEIEDEKTDTQKYFAYEKNVKMAQIWEEKADEFCERMPVKKLKKVVFLGFTGGKK